MVSLAASLKILGGRIRESRKRKGFSQEGLALAADIDRSFMGQVERGQRNVSFATLYRLATVIGCDLADLCRDLPGLAGMEGTQPGLSYLESGLSAAATVLNEGHAARERRRRGGTRTKARENRGSGRARD